jgi:RNA polymerase sigma factor (sigma-70 family)
VAERAVAVIEDRAGDAPGSGGFQSVFLAEYPALLRHLVYLTGDRHLAEDLAQETFSRLLETGDIGLRSPRAWLRKVGSNLAYNRFRDDARREERERRAETPVESRLEDVVDVRAALETLDARDRAVLLLRHAGFAYAEIAEVVGLRASSVGTTLARAQRRFREAYEPARDAGTGRQARTGNRDEE